MSQSPIFSDYNIRQTIEALVADGQNVTPWAVQSRLGGGDFLRIQQLLGQVSPKLKPHSSSANDVANSNKRQPKPLPKQENIIDKQMPAGIEASMYDMQTSLGQMANQLWNDAATSAQEQVRGKLFSVQEALQEAQQVQAETAQNNHQMKEQISQLTQEMSVLDGDHKQAVEALEHKSNALKEVRQQCDTLQKNVDSLQTENQSLEQETFNANIKVAKAECLAEIAKEQLTLAKQSEKQAQQLLDRAERNVDSLNQEMHNTSQALKDQIRDRQGGAQPVIKEAPSFERNKHYPPQELPQPSAANLDALEKSSARPALRSAQNEPQPIAALPTQPTQTRPITKAQQGATANKTRSLSDKLFDRKKSQKTNRHK